MTKARRERFWRTWLVRLTALVFVLQSVGLFLASPPPVAGPASAALTDCPHHQAQEHKGEHRKGHDHDRSDACPMCQALGCVLAGAAFPATAPRAADRLIGVLALPAPQAAPPPQPLPTPPARGPPIFV